jgi:hypothetical protein
MNADENHRKNSQSQNSSLSLFSMIGTNNHNNENKHPQQIVADDLQAITCRSSSRENCQKLLLLPRYTQIFMTLPPYLLSLSLLSDGLLSLDGGYFMSL